ncbi:MAG: TolC family protein [Phycisphaerae bacterium]|nr:TolC family protein [Phycisphaerae bacterium]
MMLGRIAQAALVLVGLVTVGCAAQDEKAFAHYAVAGPPRLAPASNPVAGPGVLPELTETSPLSDYLVYAALNNPALEAAFHRWRAELDRIPQMRALPDPQLAYRYFLDPMGSGPDMETRQTLGLSQPIPWPGKLVTGAAIAEQEAAAVFEQFLAERLKLAQQVASAYYEYAFLGRAIAIAEENSRLMEYVESVARTRYAAAAGSHPDVIRAQVELGKLQNELASMHDMLSVRAAKLNAALNRPVDASLPVPKQVETPQVSLQEQRLLKRLTEDNPQLRAMDRDVAARELGVDLAKQGYLPDFMVGVEWMDMTARSGSMMDADDNWAFMVGLTLPVWWDKNAAAVREARARRQAAQLARTDMVNMLQVELKLAAYEYRDATRRISLYRDTLLPKARESFRATEAAYTGGQVGFSDLVDSQRMWLEFQLAYERALADSQQHLAEVRALIGQVGDTTQDASPEAAPASGGP